MFPCKNNGGEVGELTSFALLVSFNSRQYNNIDAGDDNAIRETVVVVVVVVQYYLPPVNCIFSVCL